MVRHRVGDRSLLAAIQQSALDLMAVPHRAGVKAAGDFGIGEITPFAHRRGDSGWVAIPLSIVRRVTPKKPLTCSLVAPRRQ